jgi:CHAD domain-containing protein
MWTELVPMSMAAIRMWPFLTIMNRALPDIMRQPATRSELLKRRLDAFVRALKAFDRYEVRGLHRTRVASRRLRELVPILQLDHAAARKLMRRIRKVTTRLGTVRELDVLLLSIDELHVAGRGAGAALGRVGVAVSKDRDRARKRLETRLPIASLWRTARKLERLVAALQIEEAGATRADERSLRWAADARVARRAGRLSKAIEQAGPLYLTDRLHDVRISLKKLRYAAELQSEILGTRSSPLQRLLRRGQDLLGRMHDLQMLIDRVRQVHASLAPPTLIEWRDLDALVLSLEDDCRRLHARYMAIRDQLVASAGTAHARARGSSSAAETARRAG